MGQGDDNLQSAATQAESASACMFPERKDCMHIFSTEGRAFFAVWLQAVEGSVSGYMAARASGRGMARGDGNSPRARCCA